MAEQNGGRRDGTRPAHDPATADGAGRVQDGGVVVPFAVRPQ